MRAIGQCEFALEMISERALSRVTFGNALSENADIQDWIAESRVGIDHARLLNLKAAWTMDTSGNKAARTEVSAVKVVAARLQTRVTDLAMHFFWRGWPTFTSGAGHLAIATDPMRCISPALPGKR